MNRENLIKQLQKVLRHCPRFIASPIYLAVFALFVLSVRVLCWGRGWKFWIRNSFRLGSYRPFLSDLDVTLLMAHSPALWQLTRLRRIHEFFRCYFPLIGELNIYLEADLPAIASVINSYELSRDPELTTLLSKFRPLNLDKISAGIFACRMMQYDRKRLLHNPEASLRKWRQHFQSLKWNFPSVKWNLEAGVDVLVESCVPFEDRNAWKATLVGLFKALDEGVPLHDFVPTQNKTLLTKVLFPHIFCFQEFPQGPLKEEEREWMKGQICWELFAVLSQWPMKDEVRSYEAHLGRLKIWATGLEWKQGYELAQYLENRIKGLS